MAKQRITAEMRTTLFEWVAPRIKVPNEEQALKDSLQHAVNLIQARVRHEIPEEHFKVLDQYGHVSVTSKFRFLKRKDGKKWKTQDFRLETLPVYMYSRTGEIFEPDPELIWRRPRGSYVETIHGPISAQVKLPDMLINGPDDMLLKFNEKEIQILEGFDPAHTIYVKALNARMNDYVAVVMESRTVEELCEIWPEAWDPLKKFLDKPQLPSKITDGVLTRIREDMQLRAGGRSKP